jgi:hypothetical protein
MSKKKKYGEPIQIETKKPWKVARGHTTFRSADSTVMQDKRTKRKRTRSSQKRAWLDE